MGPHRQHTVPLADVHLQRLQELHSRLGEYAPVLHQPLPVDSNIRAFALRHGLDGLKRLAPLDAEGNPELRLRLRLLHEVTGDNPATSLRLSPAPLTS